MFLIYNLLFPFLFLLYFPFYMLHLMKRGGLDITFWERFGIFTKAKKAELAQFEKPVWIHAVSVGETVAALSFIQCWQKREPQRKFVLSATTTTGHALALKKAPDNVVPIYCPLDFYPIVKKVINLVKPEMLVVFEVEIWPNLIFVPAGQHIPVVMVNGRMSDKSAEGYAKHSWFFKNLFNTFAAICVQSGEDVERVAKITGSCDKITMCNTMKFDQIPDTSSGADKSEYLNKVFGERDKIIFTAGSTHPGEEELMVESWLKLKDDFPGLCLVLVPRHHERTLEVEEYLQSKGIEYQLLVDNKNSNPTDVLIVNTTGELMNFYASSDIVYVGKTLAGNTGGHNIIEPAIFGKPILHGPNMQNFRLVVKLFQEGKGAVEVGDDSQFMPELRKLLENPGQLEVLGNNAEKVVKDNGGAINKSLDVLLPLLKK